ncbi:hypothetical protein F5B19DRAFT_493362 [Rostrohypoxylon terebratum]|nr:hypothetical protein F5B19DRAFT_493362 [Rostrohypoxylon terebratum]
MRFTAITRATIAVLAVAGAGTLATPISSDGTPPIPELNITEIENGTSVPEVPYNITTSNGTEITGGIPPPPWLAHLKCIPNFFRNKRLSHAEQQRIMGCYEDYLERGEWIDRMTKCRGTRRYFQAWGHHWDSPVDCWNACQMCFESAVYERAGNLRCFKFEGLTARCAVTYE